jgi:hypothetical protein
MYQCDSDFCVDAPKQYAACVTLTLGSDLGYADSVPLPLRSSQAIPKPLLRLAIRDVGPDLPTLGSIDHTSRIHRFEFYSASNALNGEITMLTNNCLIYP